MNSVAARAATLLILALCPLLWAFDGYVLMIASMTVNIRDFTPAIRPRVVASMQWMTAAFFVLPFVFAAACKVRKRQVSSR